MSGGVTARIRTNNVPGSICRVQVPPVAFSALWAAYPEKPPYADAKTGKPPTGYENQCAIKVSAALHCAGVEMKSFRGATVPLGSKRAAARAKELAAWLKLQPFCGLPQKPEIVTGADWETKVAGRTGIIYFADYWHRSTDGENGPTGDHVDLWNGSRLTASGIVGSFVTTARYLGMRSFLPGTSFGYSDLGKSREILFWGVK